MKRIFPEDINEIVNKIADSDDDNAHWFSIHPDDEDDWIASGYEVYVGKPGALKRLKEKGRVEGKSNA